MSNDVLSLRPWDRIVRGSRQRAEVGELIEKPEAPKAIAALPELDAYVLAKSLGAEEAPLLLRFMTKPQLRTLFDFEAWQGHELSPSDVLLWLAACREAGLDTFHQAARALDPEALAAVLRRRLRIAVRPGEDDRPDERPAWIDGAQELHETPDRRFVFELRDADERDESLDEEEEVDEEERKAALRLVEDLYRDEDLEWAASIMRLAESDLSSSLEELALRFRDGRREDLGFPPRDRALELWSPLSFDALSGTEVIPPGRERLPAVMGRHLEPGLLAQALERAPELWERIESELATLLTGLLVADGVPLSDGEGVAWTVGTALGRIDIGLAAGQESDDPGVWTERLRGHDLRTLFRVGHGVTLELRRRARALEAPWGLEPELEAVLRGLDRAVPLDADPTLSALPRPVSGPGRLAALQSSLSRAEGLAEAATRLGLERALDGLPEAALPTDPSERTLRRLLTTGAARALLGEPFSVRPLERAELERLAVRLAAGGPVQPPTFDPSAGSELSPGTGAGTGAETGLLLSPGAGEALALEVSAGLAQLAEELTGRAGADVDPRFVEAVLRVP